MGRTKRVAIETRDVESAAPVSLDTNSSVKNDEIDRHDLAVVTNESMDSPNVAAYAKELAFNEDMLTISIAKVNDPNAENPVTAGVNGILKSFYRGEEYKVARKFVDQLIVTEKIPTTHTYDDKEGVKQTKIDVDFKMKYPISIIHDPSPHGRAWFQWACRRSL